jgi:hypothetical protein
MNNKRNNRNFNPNSSQITPPPPKESCGMCSIQ